MIRTSCGKKILLRYVAGLLLYLEQQPQTKSELTNNSIPHIIMTAESTWNPRIIKTIFFRYNAHQYLVPSLFLIQSQRKEKFTELVIENFTTRYTV